MLSIRQQDGGWEVPKGEVAGHSVLPTGFKSTLKQGTAMRDISPEEEGNLDASQRLTHLVDELLDSTGHPIYSGYRDDPANTDNSW